MLTTSESTAVILPNKHSLCQIKDRAHHKKKKKEKSWTWLWSQQTRCYLIQFQRHLL